MVSSLVSFSIRRVEEDSFPEEGLLPITLTQLTIQHCRNLECLRSRALQHLTSLKNLFLTSCEKLWCLPEEGLPTSLSSLCIYQLPLTNSTVSEGRRRRLAKDFPHPNGYNLLAVKTCEKHFVLSCFVNFNFVQVFVFPFLDIVYIQMLFTNIFRLIVFDFEINLMYLF